ncbi:hypothetical protein Cgig2_005853 [Carnegiea gigantea]|uniref:V-ATPase proteolipid subunit C-like domain-containing protein n=1 Tax=Carnegiea gigantea TaxID=171969 RepID=A0A9Q1QL35_9CARY|nr:hypothetical protein Cgig2_005853 [Carnegiea gigantea]
MSSTFNGDETAPFFGFLGAAAALVFSCAYGSGVWNGEKWRRSGVHGSDEAGIGDEIDCSGGYGWCFGTGINPKAKSYYLFDGYAHLSSGLACGLAGLSAGMAIGIVGDAGVSCTNYYVLMVDLRTLPASRALSTTFLVFLALLNFPLPPLQKCFLRNNKLFGTRHIRAWVVLSLGLKRKRVRASMGLKNGVGLTPCKAKRKRANAQQPKLFVGMILILIFAEALALYGLIVGIILSSRAGQSRAD